MIFAGILLAAIAALFMASFYEYGKRVGYSQGLIESKKIFANFKLHELEYVPKKDLLEYLDTFVDEGGNDIPDWYPVLIVKPDSMEAGIEIKLKGE